jgi:glucuronokinase
MLLAGEPAGLGELLDANFDRRRSICPIAEGNVQMVETARQAGASAKFTGSGGAIIGTYGDEETYSQLTCDLARIGVQVLRPIL